MSKILSVEELLEAISTFPGEVRADDAVSAVIDAVSKLADLLAEFEGVTHTDTSYQPGFGGLCSTFKPGPDGQTSDLIGDHDPGGDWED